MEKLFDKVNLIGGGIVTVLVAIFGPMWILFAGFLILNVIDWLSGWCSADKRHEYDSKIGARGIVKKIWYWIIIAVAFYLGVAFQKLGEILGISLEFMKWIGWCVLSNYIVNETRSILENVVEMGIPVPTFLIKGLKITGDIIDGVVNVALPQEDSENKKEDNDVKK